MYDPTLLPPDFFEQNRSNFSVKLTHEQRCAAYALWELGFDRAVVGAVFAVHKQTIGYITNTSSRHYKSVRAERSGTTQAEFAQKYLSNETLLKARHFVEERRANGTVRPKIESLDYNSKARAHETDSRYCNFNGMEFYYAVKWYDFGPDAERHAGWCWCDLDEPLTWYGPFYTSQGADRAARSYEQLKSDQFPSG